MSIGSLTDRLRRLESLSITIRAESPESEVVHLHPLKRATKPRQVEVPCEWRTAATLAVRSGRFGFELDLEFWQHLKSHPVPLPLALMRQFHNRPQAWDFAAFLLYRCFAARSPIVVPWNDLIDQLGARDSFPRRLKAALARVLREIWVVFPGFPPRFLPGFRGLAVEPWRQGSSLGLPAGQHPPRGRPEAERCGLDRGRTRRVVCSSCSSIDEVKGTSSGRLIADSAPKG